MVPILSFLHLYTFSGSNIVSCFYPSGGSDAKPVQNGQAWRSSNFALVNVVDILQFIVDQVKEVRCPCDPFCASQNICAGIINTVVKIMDAINFPLHVVRVGRPNSSSQTKLLSHTKNYFAFHRSCLFQNSPWAKLRKPTILDHS